MYKDIGAKFLIVLIIIKPLCVLHFSLHVIFEDRNTTLLPQTVDILVFLY